MKTIGGRGLLEPGVIATVWDTPRGRWRHGNMDVVCLQWFEDWKLDPSVALLRRET
jgi:hypothetical protein